ncbi:MAG TPA: hypothetical protein VG818_08815 [Gemmatimonadaceae bacterium]|jgi:hypothetical protein|nr:hypothetical protein [Gemmatimonadaceae bacterium]
MPKNRPADSDSAPSDDPIAHAQAVADALCRTASECCRQHDRVARILERSELDAELAAAQKFCELCDMTLQEMMAAYETALGALPAKADGGWAARGTSLWQASREYLRRHSSCDHHLTRKRQRHGSNELGELAMEFELEASAVLALRQATEAYRKERPSAA